MIIDDALEILLLSKEGQPVPSASVRSTLVEDFWSLPAGRERLRAAWMGRHAEEWNATRVGVERISWGGADGVRLVARTTDWREIRAWQEPVQEGAMAAPESLRILDDALSCTFPTPLVVHAIVRTADDRVVAARRSPALHYHPGAWSFTFEEGVELVDFQDGGDVLRACALRGLAEEFRLPPSTGAGCSVGAVAIVAERGLSVPTPVVVVDVPLSAKEFLAFAPDEREVVAVSVVDMELGAVTRWLADIAPAPLHPTARYRLFRIMAMRFGESAAGSAVLDSLLA